MEERTYARPAIMSAPMALATLLNKKDVTRRLAGLELVNLTPDEYEFTDYAGKDRLGRRIAVFTHKVTRHVVGAACPYGDTDDQLYIRENWAVGKGYDDVRPRSLPTPRQQRILTYFAADGPYPEHAGKPRPAIHLPKAHCRTWVSVMSIRVERLQDITEEGAKSEGVLPVEYKSRVLAGAGHQLYRIAFKQLWAKLNGQQSWDHNPWVWVITFAKIATP